MIQSMPALLPGMDSELTSHPAGVKLASYSLLR